MNALLDTLIPGDDDFPSAGSLGMHEALLTHDRFRTAYEAILDLLPAGFADLSIQTRASHMIEIEAREPDYFNGLIVGVYSLYYTHADVTLVIERLTGHTTRPPQPEGHLLEPFTHELVAIPAGRLSLYRPTPEYDDD
jgi:hypothetical protein